MTESGSASVHVCGLFGRPDTAYRDARGSVGPDGMGGGALTETGGAERADATEVRLLPGMGSILWCLRPRMRAALSVRAGTTACACSGSSTGWSTVTYSKSSSRAEWKEEDVVEGRWERGWPWLEEGPPA